MKLNNLDSIPGEVIADEDADYSEVIKIDISDIGPMVSEPPYPHNVKKVSGSGKVDVNFGFIGSCTNGRLEDIETAWKILRGKRIADGVRLAVVPATRRVYMEAMKRGMLQDLLEAGAIISNPGCGGCASLRSLSTEPGAPAWSARRTRKAGRGGGACGGWAG